MLTSSNMRLWSKLFVREKRLTPGLSSAVQQTVSRLFTVSTELDRLPPVLGPPSPPPPETVAPKKGIFARVVDRYSITAESLRGLTTERMFQAAYRQANDP